MFTKIALFPQTEIYDSLIGFLPNSYYSKPIEEAYQNEKRIIFARIIDDSCDMSSLEALNIGAFRQRDIDNCMVYVSSRRSSIFHGDLNQLETLIDEGYQLYPVDEYEHGGIDMRLLSNTPITKVDFLSGQTFKKYPMHCRFDSSLAFIALPNDEHTINQDSLDIFVNWINGYAFAYQILEAVEGVNGFGDPIYDIRLIDSSHGFLDEENAIACAEDSLYWEISQEVKTM